MTIPRHERSLDPAVLKLARYKACGLAGRYGFSLADADDICQELLLDCLVRLRRFDPTKSSRHTFVRQIVDHRVATLLDSHRAGCRDYRRCWDSLDAPLRLATGESVVFGETLSADGYEARMGRGRRSSHEDSELRIDVAKVISLLPRDLAMVAVLLMSLSVVEAARQLGLARSTLYRRVGQIRTAFAVAGLDCYIRGSKPLQPGPPSKHSPHVVARRNRYEA